MATFHLSVGDKVINDYPSDYQGRSNPNCGKKGTVTAIYNSNRYVEVIYEDGSEGLCTEYGNSYKKINSLTLMKKLSNFITKVVDADTQALIKAGYVNGDLEPTAKAFDKIKEITFFANKAALVEAANAEIAEAEAEAKKA